MKIPMDFNHPYATHYTLHIFIEFILFLIRQIVDMHANGKWSIANAFSHCNNAAAAAPVAVVAIKLPFIDLILFFYSKLKIEPISI